MEDLFKKFINTSIGFATSTLENVKKTINEFVEQGKLTEQEGMRVMKDLKEDMDKKKGMFEEKVKTNTEKIMSKFDFATRKDIEALKARITDLEAKLAEQNKKETEETKEETSEATETSEEAQEDAPEENND